MGGSPRQPADEDAANPRDAMPRLEDMVRDLVKPVEDELDPAADLIEPDPAKAANPGAAIIGGDQPALQVELAPLVDRLLNDVTLTREERAELAIFHGQWDKVQRDLTTVQQARVALQTYDLDHPSLADPEVPNLIRGEAALRENNPQKALILLAGEPTMQAGVLRAEAHVMRGDVEAAITELQPIVQQANKEKPTGAGELTAAARALLMLADLQGRPSRDYHQAMRWLGDAHSKIDRLYWPASLVEAQTLFDKNNGAAGIAAIQQTLSLNPNSSDGWHLLGMAAIGSFDFDRGEKVVAKLRSINPTHPLAELVAAHMYLQQKDGESALKHANALLERYPEHREALALKATARRLVDPAAHAGDELALLAEYDELQPGGSDALVLMGSYLSLARQYLDAGTVLREAIRRQPTSAAAHTELGLMLMQLGDERSARLVLEQAAQIDPFNVRAVNQYQLSNELAGYEEIRTDNFIIRYPAGEIGILAKEMPAALEKIHDDITGVYEYDPKNPTIIEILPDEERFGVRITGMPDIWTIAACTGDVIAMVAPREGRKQRGTFDWERVIRHEYVHTVTLNQTGFRIPHWFTEACAVSQEPGGRDFNAMSLLTQAYEANELFDLREINWAFVRPKRPQDRALAYAQAHWMNEYITETFGHQAILDMLRMYKEGVGDVKAVEVATGQSQDEYMAGFMKWAGEHVQQWGLMQPDPDPQIENLLSKRPLDKKKLGQLLTEKPEHPVLLQVSAALAMQDEDYKSASQFVERFAEVRPVDPWVDRMQLQIALRENKPKDAIAPLVDLDSTESMIGDYAYQLTELYRQTGNIEAAAGSSKRAVGRAPFNPKYRELAATVALQAGDMDEALHQMKVLAELEPHQAIHQLRVAAILQRMGRSAEARDAALRAQAANPNLNIDRFFD